MEKSENERQEKKNVPSFEVLRETENYVEIRIDKSIINISQNDSDVIFGYRLEGQPQSAIQRITIPESQFTEIIAAVVKEVGESLIKDISESLGKGIGNAFAEEIGEGMKEFSKEFPLAILGAALGMMIHVPDKRDE